MLFHMFHLQKTLFDVGAIVVVTNVTVQQAIFNEIQSKN
jgi:hypothetical protein